MMRNSGNLEEYTLKFRISQYLLVAFFVVTPVPGTGENQSDYSEFCLQLHVTFGVAGRF